MPGDELRCRRDVTVLCSNKEHGRTYAGGQGSLNHSTLSLKAGSTLNLDWVVQGIKSLKNLRGGTVYDLFCLYERILPSQKLFQFMNLLLILLPGNRNKGSGSIFSINSPLSCLTPKKKEPSCSPHGGCVLQLHDHLVDFFLDSSFFKLFLCWVTQTCRIVDVG